MKNKDNLIIGLLAGLTVTVGVLAIVIYKRKSIATFAKKIINKVNDAYSEKIIQTLHPAIRDKTRQFINEAEKQGIKIRITSGYRTYEEQNKLYAKGRTTSGDIVTNAKGGQSNHNFALAIDVVQIINGSANYKKSDWNKIAEIGKSIGFSWGGDWKGLVDKPHFEMLFGNTLASLQNKVANNQTENGYIII